ncbi:hypothetical protein PYW07_009908 [Mythimna separata]|uniref:C-type lectin domain-containing protein n=1 Tax=Mythimna separata TaxID=271217 RepID=A0AAD8DPS6_MYTSE|nr:hypothetical protein PYW07_009908 [Mythimna separata]
MIIIPYIYSQKYCITTFHLSCYKMKSKLKYFLWFFILNTIEGTFRCDYKYNAKAQAWFKLIVMPATWFDARLRCSLEGAVLASPTTPEILAEMKNIMNHSNAEFEIFTGIHATISQGDFYTIEGTPFSNIPATWAVNEPDNKNNEENCITLNGKGELADLQCKQTRPYICYRPKTFEAEANKDCGTVDLEYQLDKRTNKCYKFHTTPRNFSQAYLACSAEGGHLAIINSDTEATVLKDLLEKYPESKLEGNFRKDRAFIGFHAWNGSWDWRTIHGQKLMDAGYSRSEVSPGTVRACGAIDRHISLGDWWCEGTIPFICEKAPDFPGTCPIFSENGQKESIHVM